MKRILIVEDDRAIAELERDYLEANDYEVEICEDGESGLKRALQEDFALILLDVMLPKEDGFQVCRNLRASKNVPIILVSAKREDMDKIRGLGLGANDYIVKPFNPSELIARVKSQIANYERLTQGAQKKENLLQIENLMIDLNSHEVFLDGESLVLPNKEFELSYSLPKIRISFSARISCLKKYGDWMPSVKSLPLPYTSIGSVRKSKRTVPIRNLSKPYGEAAIVSANIKRTRKNYQSEASYADKKTGISKAIALIIAGFPFFYIQT